MEAVREDVVHDIQEVDVAALGHAAHDIAGLLLSHAHLQCGCVGNRHELKGIAKLCSEVDFHKVPLIGASYIARF